MSIRIALGAEPGMVKALFVSGADPHNAPAALSERPRRKAPSRRVSSLLFGVTPLDPLVYGVSGAMILATAMTASYIPSPPGGVRGSNGDATQ